MKGIAMAMATCGCLLVGCATDETKVETVPYIDATDGFQVPPQGIYLEGQSGLPPPVYQGKERP